VPAVGRGLGVRSSPCGRSLRPLARGGPSLPFLSEGRFLGCCFRWSWGFAGRVWGSIGLGECGGEEEEEEDEGGLRCPSCACRFAGLGCAGLGVFGGLVSELGSGGSRALLWGSGVSLLILLLILLLIFLLMAFRRVGGGGLTS
jgi:hypothetical protein